MVPAPTELTLPSAIDLDLPTPAQHSNLLAPTGLDLEPAGIGLEPAGIGLEPAGIGLEPTGTGLEPTGTNLAPAGSGLEPAGAGLQSAQQGLEPAAHGLEPAGLGLEPAHQGLVPRAPGVPGAVADDQMLDERGMPRARPRPREVRAPVSRGVLYGGAALLLVGALGGIVSFSGVFADDPPQPTTRGLPPKSEGNGNGNGKGKPPNKGTDTANIPAAALAERSAQVLAQLAMDTPLSYAQVVATTKAAGDRVGEAEASLLMHLRYGPAPKLQSLALDNLTPYSSETAAHVLRVRGLAALGAKNYEGAKLAFAGDHPQAIFYRGLLQLAQSDGAGAAQTAKALRAALPEAANGIWLEHAAGLLIEPTTDLAGLKASIAAHPEHSGMRELLINAAIARGELKLAATAANALTVTDDVPTYKARALALHGKVAVARGDLATAIDKYGAALAASPNNTEVQLERGHALLSALDLKEALLAADTLQEQQPASVEAAIFRIELAVKSGDGDGALDRLDALEATNPGLAAIHLWRGEVQAMRLQVEEGEAEFAKALEIDPSHLEATIARIRMLAAARQPKAAITAVDAALATYKDSAARVRLFREKATLLAGQRKIKDALTALDKALEEVPHDNGAGVQRGTLRLQAGRYDEGKLDLLAVYQRTAGFPGLATPLGRIFVRDGKVTELEELVGDTAENPHASVELKLVGARLRLAQGKIEPAKVLLEAALGREPNNWEGRMLLARAFMDAGDTQEALVRIEQAQPPTPNAEVSLLKGKILEFNARHGEARPQYALAIKLDPQLHEARFLYGRLLAYAGASRQAADQLRVVCDATNRFPGAWLNLGRAQRDLGQSDKAKASLEKALVLDPTQYEGFYLLGRILADAGRFAPGSDAFEKAIVNEAKGTSWYVDALIATGRAQVRAGRRKAAKTSFTKFLELSDPKHTGRSDAQRQLRDL